jgi:hypothetical protein
MAGKTDICIADAETAAPPAPCLAGRALLLCIAGLLALALLVGCSAARAAPRDAEVTGAVADGFARVVLTFPDEIETEVRQSNGILVIAFKEPLAIDVEHLARSLPGYVSVVRADPDGAAIRLALMRKVTINTMAAGERLFVDLLPDGWTGLPPGLPREVIEDLARRARAADKIVRDQQHRHTAEASEPVRVRVASLPTLTRYTFDLRGAPAVTTDRRRNAFTVGFDKPLRFDLADARASLPANVASVEADTGETAATVRFSLVGRADIRSFREDNAFVVDIAAPDTAAAPGSIGRDMVVPQVKPAAAGSAPAPAAAPAQAPAKPERSAAKTAPAIPPPAPPFMDEPVRSPAAERPPSAVPPAQKAATPAPPPPPQQKIAAAPPPPPPAPAAAPVAASPAAPAPPSAPAAAPNGAVAAFAKPQGDTLRLLFPFRAPTAAAVFRRGDTLWLVFDAATAIDLTRLRQDAGRTVLAASAAGDGKGQVVRLRLDRPYLSAAFTEGDAWVVTLGDSVQEPTRPLAVERVVNVPTHASAAIAFADAHAVHALRDPDAGARLFVVTGPAPARGLAKTQEFVEFRALASTQGIAIEPLADDVTVEAVPERVVIARPNGLTLTPAAAAGAAPGGGLHASHTAALDVQSWGFDRQAEFLERRAALMSALSDAPEAKRNAARIDLARFYLARDMYPEAKGPLDVVVGSERDNDALARALVLRAIAELMMDRPRQALKDLGNPIVGNQHEAQLWRALGLSRMGRFSEAREGLRNVAAASAALPLELQRFALKESVRCAVEVGDFAVAQRQLNDFDAIGAPPEMKGALAVLSGRVAEGLGKIDDALGAYALAAGSRDAPAVAQGQLRQTQLRHRLHRIKPEEATEQLERLAAGWRGDDTELEALQLLATLYTDADRFRDAFQVMRVAIAAHPRAMLTQHIQDQAAKTFEAVFSGPRGEKLPPAEALALFYDFRGLTPPGGRGDTMIRRLAERLIGMDLLKQASELLQHQVDHRLKGAARAEVAARLATVYLMDRKPEQALAALRASRMSGLSEDLRHKRLLLEARSLSEVGRHDLALEIIEDMSGREVARLRADIHWNARHWRLAAEQIERLYGERWRDFAPLDAFERTDVLRAAIGYALAEDTIGLDRFRQKYAAKMAEGRDRRLFEVLTAPLSARGEEFAAVAKSASSVDTLGAFLRDLRERFPEPADKMSAAPPPPRG